MLVIHSVMYLHIIIGDINLNHFYKPSNITKLNNQRGNDVDALS